MQSDSRIVTPIALLRCVAAILMMAHGVARISNGAVYEFGVFLDQQGVPVGETIAWMLTVMEIVGGLALLIGQLITVFSALFVVELIMGIALVHFREGWFVVGIYSKTNGMEYSVLLIAVLIAVGWDVLLRPKQLSF